MELLLHLELFTWWQATCRAIYGTGGFPDNALGCQCRFVLCLQPQGCRRRGVRASGSSQERIGKSGSFGMWHHPRAYVSNILVRPASSWSVPRRSGTPIRKSKEINPPVSIRRGEGAQMKWSRKLRCYPRVRPVCQENFGVASRVPSTVSHFNMECGTSLETL